MCTAQCAAVHASRRSLLQLLLLLLQTYSTSSVTILHSPHSRSYVTGHLDIMDSITMTSACLLLGDDDVTLYCSNVTEYDVTGASTDMSDVVRLASSAAVAGDWFPTWQIVVIGSLTTLVSLVTICGNIVVILSFVLQRHLRQLSNYFIASLACSDLLTL